MDSKKLIEAVRSLDSLWNVKSPGYKDKRRPENAWKEVSGCFGFPNSRENSKLIYLFIVIVA